MKKIGLVGGIGPASTVDYYIGLINKCRIESGDTVYPEIVIDSVNMVEATDYLLNGDNKKSTELMLRSINNLKAAGAEIAAITANTEHTVWDEMKDFFEIPVISIVEVGVNETLRLGYKRVLILGTVFTLNSGIYEKCFAANGITPITPCDDDKERIGKLIYPNLENGIVVPKDKAEMLEIINKYVEYDNADAILLGCTELPLMIKEDDVKIPLLDTTQIHIGAIYNAAKK